MNKIIILLFLVSSVNYALSQTNFKKPEFPIDSITNKVCFEEIVKVPEKSKLEIYSFCREWIALNFVNSQRVVQMEDKDLGKIIVKATSDQEYSLLRSHTKVPYTLGFNLTFTTKDYKVKIVVTDFTIRIRDSKYNLDFSKSLEESIAYNKKYFDNMKSEDASTVNIWVDQASDVLDLGNGLLRVIKEYILINSKKKTDF